VRKPLQAITPGEVGLLLLTVVAVFGSSEQSSGLLEQGSQEQRGTKGLATVAEQQLMIEPNEFWSDPLKKARKLQLELMGKSREALLVDAPAEINVDVRDKVPVVVVRTAKIVNAAGSPFAQTAILTAVDLENNYTYADLAITPTGRQTDYQDKAPREPLQDGMIGEVFALDARPTLNLPWKPARFVVTLIIRDSPAPRLRVRLMESESGYKDPEVARFREQERLRPNVPAAWPPPDPRIAVYEAGPDSPHLPENAGINMTAPRIVQSGEKQPCKLAASFRLPILPKHIVPRGKADGAAELLAQYRSKYPDPTGVVPITLVATGSKVAVPFVWRLVVPTFDKIDPAKPELVTGNFTVDLESLGNITGIQQTLFVYAFSNEFMAGPVMIGVVER
jgi:hypothetical protein